MELNLLDEIHAVVAVDHTDSKPSFAEASSAADPVEVRLIVSVAVQVNREVKVDHK